jgi:hypothetical protein
LLGVASRRRRRANDLPDGTPLADIAPAYGVSIRGAGAAGTERARPVASGHLD